VSDSVLAQTRAEMNEWAREKWPVPTVSLGWLQVGLPGSAEYVAMKQIDKMGTTKREVSGRSYGRVVGYLYPWGATFYPKTTESAAILVMPDSAIRNIEEIEGSTLENPDAFIKRLAAAGALGQRVDCTVDFQGYEIDNIWEVSQDGIRDYGPWRSARHIDSRQITGGGRSVMFGAYGRGGQGVIVYEKGKQLREAHDILRIEYRSMHESALACLSSIFAGGEVRSRVAGFIDHRMYFREGMGRSRREDAANGHANRCLSYGWWSEMVDRVGEAIPFKAEYYRDGTMDSLEEWMRKSWIRPLAKMQYAYGSDGAWARFMEIWDTAICSELDEFDKKEIDAWKASANGLASLE